MKLTTITPYWNRPEMLRKWIQSLRLASHPEVLHLVYFVGEGLPSWWESETKGLSIVPMLRSESPGLSIGHYHNLGIEQATTEWVMKLDVDAFPHEHYFQGLLPILENAKPREWFNGGMFYLNKYQSNMLFPLTTAVYRQIMSSPRSYSASSYLLPAATNFICRREDYLSLGGCDSRFRGYGWEDYQQIYMLEFHQRQTDPLPGTITLDNVTRRCRDEISRRKARELWDRSGQLLCLIHYYHATEVQFRGSMEKNRQILLDYILKRRAHG